MLISRISVATFLADSELDLNPAQKNKDQNYDQHHTQNACRRWSPSCRIRPSGQCPDKQKHQDNEKDCS
jgi:hypothetical protein